MLILCYQVGWQAERSRWRVLRVEDRSKIPIDSMKMPKIIEAKRKKPFSIGSARKPAGRWTRSECERLEGADDLDSIPRRNHSGEICLSTCCVSLLLLLLLLAERKNRSSTTFFALVLVNSMDWTFETSRRVGGMVSLSMPWSILFDPIWSISAEWHRWMCERDWNTPFTPLKYIWVFQDWLTWKVSAVLHSFSREEKCTSMIE